MVAGIKAEEAV